MTRLESRPHVKSLRRDIDEDDGEPITVIVTDLVMNKSSPRLDERAFDDLTRHVEAWQSEGVRRVTIEGPWE